MRRLLNVLVIASLLLAVFPLQVHAHFGQSLLQQDQFGTGLYRAVVQISHPTRLDRLNSLGIKVLHSDATSAEVLVSETQLQTLARLRYKPAGIEEFGQLVQRSADSAPLAASLLTPLVDIAQQAAQASAAAKAPQNTSAADIANRLSPEASAALAALTTIDDDGDGLTNTQESWWCTDPLNRDSDADGKSDGQEIQVIKDWLGNRRSGPAFETPWSTWPFNNTTCPDKDHDSIPNLAELELGLNMDLESTDLDKFDDGQELFGVTACPGGDLNCGYGDLPRSSDSGYVGSRLPAWVKTPGNHPFAAAFPIPEIGIVNSSFTVQTVAEITTDHVISKQTTRSYSTTSTKGTSTEKTKTTYWNKWQEFSSTEEAKPKAPIIGPVNKPIRMIMAAEIEAEKARLKIFDNIKNLCSSNSDGWSVNASVGVELAKVVEIGVGGEYSHSWQDNQIVRDWLCLGAIKRGIAETSDDTLRNELLILQKMFENTYQLRDQAVDPAATTSVPQIGYRDVDMDNIVGALNGIKTAIDGLGQALSERYYPIETKGSGFVPTNTTSRGSSRGGSVSTTTSSYEEHAVTNGEAFSDGESWGDATSTDTAHAADFWFTYTVRNSGTEYAREVGGLIFNVYFTDFPNPIVSYPVAGDLGGDGVFHNLMPGEQHTYTSGRIALTLEQLKALDTGAKIRIEVEDFSFEADELFYENALGANQDIAIDDGPSDGKISIDHYSLATSGDQTFLDLIPSYFPTQFDEKGDLNAIWTPEYLGTTPAWCQEPIEVGAGLQRVIWCKHALSISEWWTIFSQNPGDENRTFEETPAVPGSAALIRFDQDSDMDGYSDRSEIDRKTDPNNTQDFPAPDLIGSVFSSREGNAVTSILSLFNGGLYDAYNVEAVMVAPDDSITITKNAVGGSGHVKAGKTVTVGSIIEDPVYSSSWRGAELAIVTGYYTGPTDISYTFTVDCITSECEVGKGSWSIDWINSNGTEGNINFGAGYTSPRTLPIGGLGLELGMISGHVFDGNQFTVAVTTAKDPFTYTINREPYTLPMVIVSYSDPQGSHRLVVPFNSYYTSVPDESLSTVSGAMLPEPDIEIISQQAFTTGQNTVTIKVVNPQNAILANSKLHLEVINSAGKVVSRTSGAYTLLPGPNLIPVTWNSGSFSPAFSANDTYLLMAYWTDYQDNILNVIGRPLDNLAADKLPKVMINSTNWDIGTITQGQVITKEFYLANVGFAELSYGFDVLSLGLSSSQQVGTIGSGMFKRILLTIDTLELPLGDLNRIIKLYTSDPNSKEFDITIHGIVNNNSNDTLSYPITSYQPFDRFVRVIGPKDADSWSVFDFDLITGSVDNTPLQYFDGIKSATLGTNSTFKNPIINIGDGRDGDLLITTGQNLIVNTTRTNINASQKNGIVTAVTGFNVGDKVLLHQTQYSNFGQYEIATISSINGANSSLLFDEPLKYSYVTNVATGQIAQINKIPQYRNVVINSGGMLSAPDWDGYTGGILIFFAHKISNEGIIQANGTGLRGGIGAYNNPGKYGEGHSDINGGGGGSGISNGGWYGGGGGGGHATIGGNGDQASSASGGPGGFIVGDTNLTILTFGGGGGATAGSVSSSVVGGHGGDGGGAIYIAAAALITQGTISANGNPGTNSSNGRGGGGGGAGGSIRALLLSELKESSNLTCNGNSGGIGGVASGGKGGQGRIKVDIIPETLFWIDPNSGVLRNLEQITTDTIFQVQFGQQGVFSSVNEYIYQVRLPQKVYKTLTFDTWFNNLSITSSPAFQLDFGNDGAYDWTPPELTNQTKSISSPDLSAALNAYLTGKTPDADGTVLIPIRVHLNGTGEVYLTNLNAIPYAGDLAISAADLSSSAPTVNETQTVHLSAVVHNLARVAVENVMVDFFAGDPAAGGLYIGSDFLASIAANGTQTAGLDWTTTGVTGSLQIYAVADYADQLLEPDETNNQASLALTVLARPELNPQISLSDPAPITSRTLTISVNVRNDGQLNAGTSSAKLYLGDPANGGVLLDGVKSVPATNAGGANAVAFNWTPAAPGSYRLYALADSANAVNESNEYNNQSWLDVNVGLPAHVQLDSGAPASDLAFAPASGYGYLDPENNDILTTCSGAGSPENSLRRDPGGKVNYRFDYLAPSHFYHLDVVLYECDGPGRQETITIDGSPVAGPEDLGDRRVHRLSILVDPIFYVDGSLQVGIESLGIDGAVVAAVNLADIDYRYIDAGGASDGAYGGERNAGYVETGSSASATWGLLPYQSTRVNQAASSLTYRFSSLDPARSYNLHLTFWQQDGAARLQKVAIGATDTGLQVNSGDFLVHRETLKVPLSEYQTDGTIDLIITRVGGATGAFINEVALEEETLAASTGSGVGVTPYYSEVYGKVTINVGADGQGQQAPAGTVVEAFTPRGELAGSFTVSSSGDYGYMRIYGEDTSAQPAIPGMRAGELVTFKVNGLAAVANPPFYWQSDFLLHPIDLSIGSLLGQNIVVNGGWNFISLNVEPPSPLINTALTSIFNRFDLVLSESAVYDTRIDPVYNTLKELRAGRGYYLRLTGTTSALLTVDGLKQVETTPIALHQGWNWIGYLPSCSQPVATSLSSIAGKYQLLHSTDRTYNPADLVHSTLSVMEPGRGYMIFMNSAQTLVYPACPSGNQPEVPTGELPINGVAPTPYFTIVYGDVLINSQPAPAGTRVEVITPRGELAGYFEISEPGVLAYTHVYGAAASDEPGFIEGEPLAFRVNGLPAGMSQAITWTTDYDLHQIQLITTSTPLFIPLLTR